MKKIYDFSNKENKGVQYLVVNETRFSRTRVPPDYPSA